jgi:hypothetical protein
MTSITLCCIDCVNQPLAVRALRLSMPALQFAETLFLTSGVHDFPDLRVEYIPPLQSHAEYSHFVAKTLVAHIHTSHVLLVQWDGYIINPSAWTDEFLQYDYIGATWGFHKDVYRVGNGGFSLRSKRLLEALRDPEIVETHPEDVAICRQYRPLLEQRYGIRFAPEAIAERFSFESTTPADMPFGFHALHNMWACLKPEDLHDFLGVLTPDVLKSRSCLLLARNLLTRGRRQEAIAVLQCRLQVLPADAATVALLKQANSLLQTCIIQMAEKARALPLLDSFLPWLAQLPRLRLRRRNKP